MERHIFWKLALIVGGLLLSLGNLVCEVDDPLDNAGTDAEESLEDYFLKFAESDNEGFLVDLSDMEKDDIIKEESDEFKGFEKTYKNTFPLIMNSYVEKEITYLTVNKRDFLVKSLDRAENYIIEMRAIIKKYDLPEELVYLPIIESGFNYRAYSRKGAAGMWQFMPGTASWMGMQRNGWVDERFDPVVSCEYAAKYLSLLYNAFNDWYLALAAYNYGGGNVQRAIKRCGSREFYDLVKKRVIPAETQRYVPRFIAAVYIMKNIKNFNIDYKESEGAYEYVTLPFTSPSRLVARYAGLSLDEFTKLNPALRSPFVPNDKLGYNIRLPQENIDILKANMDTLKEQSASDYQIYYIRRGDSLSEIALRYGVSITVLMSVNGISNSHKIWEGQKLYIPVSYNALKKANSSLVPASNNNSGSSHVVCAGETVSGIALQYGISVDNLVRLNNLREPFLIKAGQVLRIR